MVSFHPFGLRHENFFRGNSGLEIKNLHVFKRLEIESEKKLVGGLIINAGLQGVKGAQEAQGA